jgi:hypothetical protein
MNELTKFLIEELLDTKKTVAIYGGGFKPPTKGHFNVAKQTLEELPDIDELKIFVGGGVRDGITQDESLKIWEIYKPYLSNKVSIEPSVAPVKSVLGYAKENPDTKVYWILGAREGEESDLTDIASRTKSISKYPNLEVKVITSTGGISGTKTRQALKANNKEQFFQFIPNIKEKEQIWNIVSPVIKEVGEANLKPYEWKEVYANGPFIFVEFITDSETEYKVDLTEFNYIDNYLNNYDAFAIVFTAKPKGAEGGSAKIVVNKGELYRVMATITDIIKYYVKKFKAKAISYSPSKKSDEEDFGSQRDNLYRAFISKAIPGVRFEQSEDDITAILPNTMINEGRYDSITRLVVKDIMDSWKSQFNGKEGELRFEEDYELENSKGQPIDFELLAVLKLEETEDKTYIVDGGANEELDPPYLEVTFQVDPRNLPKMWSTIYNDLIDVVRHEIEHLTQSGTNVIPSKEMADDQSIRQMINWGLLPQAEYFKLEKEVDAMLQGMYLKAKKSKTPFKDVINDYFEKVGLEGEDKQDVLNLWTKRLKALNLPPIQEAAKRIPQKTKSGKKLPASKHSDLYTDEDPKGTITGLGFKDASTAREGVSKINKAKTTHAHKVQATLVMKQRAKVAIERTKDPEKKKSLQAAYKIWSDKLEQLKRKTKSMKKENVAPNHNGRSGRYGSGYTPYTPVKEDLFGLNKLVETFVKEAFEEDWNLQDGMLSLTKYMIDNGMNIKPLPKIKVIKDDKENASNLLGKTAYYNPADKSITLFTMNRHPKDVLRSFAHEMVHHEQNLEGRLGNINTTNTNKDGDLPEIEKEAYEKGNMMLRNWEDSIKNV